MTSAQPADAVNTEREQRRRRLKRVQLPMGLFALLMGLFAFFGVAGNPRFESIHVLDVIRLMTAGAGFGVALVVLIQYFCLPDLRSEERKE